MARQRQSFVPTFIILVFVSLNFENVYCACKLHDASWEAGKGPLISQPSKNDPTKVKVDWSTIIKNARCVDEYFLLVWKKNTAKESGQKLSIANKGTVSFIAEVEACVEYNFVMEYVENDLLRQDRGQSAASPFKTEAIPIMRSKDLKNFHVGYYFDTVKGVNDLTKVSIKFPKKMIDHANCIKHLEVVGHVNNGPHRLPQQQNKNTQSVFNAETAAAMYPDHDHSHGWHGKGLLNQSSTSGIRQKRDATTTTTTTTSTSKPPAASGIPGSLTVFVPPPFLSETIEALVEGVEPCKPYVFTLKVVSPLNSILGEISGLDLLPLAEIDDYHPPSLSKLFIIDHVTSTIKLQPGLGVPFTCLATFFEAVDRHMQRLEEDVSFHVRQEFESNLKVKYFRQEFRTVQSAHLKLLGCKCQAPTINLVTTDSTVQTRFPNAFGAFHFEGIHQGKPYYTNPSLRTGSFDQIRSDQRIKRSVEKISCSDSNSDQDQQTDRSKLPKDLQQQLSDEIKQIQIDHASGNEPVNLFFGQKPSLVRKRRFLEKLLRSETTTPSPSSSSTTTAATTAAFTTTKSTSIGQPPSSDFSDLRPETRLEESSVPAKVSYLFWDPSDKSWVVSDALGGGKVLLKSTKNSRSACPADPESLKAWTYSATLQWKNDPNLKFDCTNGI